MKKLFAVLTALVLVLSGLLSAAAMAEEGAVPTPETFTISVNLNGDAITAMAGGQDETTAKMVSAVVELVNNLGIQVVSDGVDCELSVSLKGEPLFMAAFLPDDNGVRILSDMMPNSMLSVSEADLSSLTSSQISFDPELLSRIVAEPLSKASEEIMSRIGEPEAVSETLYDTVFTVKAPINMTTKEALLLLLNTVKEITSSEDFAQLQETLTQMGATVSVSDIDSAIENVTNSKDEDLAAMDAAVYSNEAGDTIFQCLLTQDGQESITLRVGSIAGGMILDAGLPGKLSLLVKADAAGSAELNVDYTQQEGVVINVSGNITSGEAGSAAVLSVSINGMDLAVISLAESKSGALSGSLSVEGKTEYSITALQDEQSEEYAAFMQDIQVGLMQVLSKAMQAVPDLAALMQPAQTTP